MLDVHIYLSLREKRKLGSFDLRKLLQAMQKLKSHPLSTKKSIH